MKVTRYMKVSEHYLRYFCAVKPTEAYPARLHKHLCTATPPSIQDLPKNHILCFPLNYIGMLCAGDGELRLSLVAPSADGVTESGRLEIFTNGGWGTVCDNFFINLPIRSPPFSPGSATVACRELGFERGVQVQSMVCIHSH